MKINHDSLLYSFWQFIRKPKYEPQALNKSILKKSWDIFRLTGFFLIICFIIGYLISLLLQYFNYDLSKNEIYNLFAKKNIFLVIFLALIWAPISEELSFRMIFKYSPFRFSYSIAFLCFLFIQIIITIFPIINEALLIWLKNLKFWQSLLFYIIFINSIGIILGYILKKTVNSKFIERLYAKNFSWLFYSLTLFFAFLHFFNYTDIKTIWFLAPIVILPQFLLSLNLGFIRINYGLRWSIITHFFHNFLSAAPSIILMAASTNLFQFLTTKNNHLLLNLSIGDLLVIALSSLMTLVFGLIAIFASILLLIDLFKKTKKIIA